MNANSLSSASKAAASSLSSANSQAGNPASKVSATLASGSAAASSYAKGVAGDGTQTAKAAGGIFALFSTFNLALVAIALGAAYYNGYLDGVISYVQNLLNQASDQTDRTLNQANEQKERIMKENTGHTSVRAAARDGIDTASAKARQAANQTSASINANTNTNTQQRAGYVNPNENASPMLSQQTTVE